MADPTSAALEAWFREHGGTMTVARFMQGALHHPEFGYYRRTAGEVGPVGDFSTSATLHPVLAEAIAGWAIDRRGRHRSGRRWHLIEIGGGGGQLARALLRALGMRQRFGLTYHLVEPSGPLRAAQRRRLRWYRVRWHDRVETALAAAGGEALVFSNELVDAFPCHQLIRLGDRWREVHLRLERGAVLEFDGDLSDPRLSQCSLPAEDRAPREGRRYEVHLAYRDWLAGWIDGLRRGALLTVDYGDVADELARRGTGGSLRAFFRHMRITGAGIYRRFGAQDLTADVNFTDLQRWGEELGLTNRGIVSQREFILEHAGSRAEPGAEPARDYLLEASGAGSAFKVLEQQPEPRAVS